MPFGGIADDAFPWQPESSSPCGVEGSNSSPGSPLAEEHATESATSERPIRARITHLFGRRALHVACRAKIQRFCDDSPHSAVRSSRRIRIDPDHWQVQIF